MNSRNKPWIQDQNKDLVKLQISQFLSCKSFSFDFELILISQNKKLLVSSLMIKSLIESFVFDSNPLPLDGCPENSFPVKKSLAPRRTSCSSPRMDPEMPLSDVQAGEEVRG